MVKVQPFQNEASLPLSAQPTARIHGYRPPENKCYQGAKKLLDRLLTSKKRRLKLIEVLPQAGHTATEQKAKLKEVTVPWRRDENLQPIIDEATAGPI